MASFSLSTDVPEWLLEYASSTPSSEDWFNSPTSDLLTGPLSDQSLDYDETFISDLEPQLEFSKQPAATTPSPSTTTSGSYTCTDPPCACGKSYSRQSELNKHTARATRPHTCCAPSCLRPFATKHDLTRHMREVHHIDESGKQIEKLVCPVRTCKRHRHGFGRKENLVSHIKRVHGEGIMGQPQQQLQAQTQMLPQVQVAHQAPVGYVAPAYSHLSVQAPMMKSPMGTGVGARACGELEDKLETLVRERHALGGRMVEVEQGIEALRKTILLMNGH